MTVTIGIADALAETLRTRGAIEALDEAGAMQEWLRAEFVAGELESLVAELPPPTPGERIPLTREYIQRLKESLRQARSQGAAK